MMAVKTILAGSAAVAALVSAAPASAQYGYGGGGDIIGQVIGSVIGGGSYGSPYGGAATVRPTAAATVRPTAAMARPTGLSYGYGPLTVATAAVMVAYGGGSYGAYGNGGNASSNQYAIGVCMGAVQQRLDGSYARSQYGGARVLGVSDVQNRSNGGTWSVESPMAAPALMAISKAHSRPSI